MLSQERTSRNCQSLFAAGVFGQPKRTSCTPSNGLCCNTLSFVRLFLSPPLSRTPLDTTAKPVAIVGTIRLHIWRLWILLAYRALSWIRLRIGLMDKLRIALYGLFVFYTLTKQELNGRRPLAKFLAIKLIVFFTFYQAFVVSRTPPSLFPLLSSLDSASSRCWKRLGRSKKRNTGRKLTLLTDSRHFA